MEGIGIFSMAALGYLIPFLVVLTVVVFIHEMGHFLVARWCGVRVLVFSIGFGPEIVGFNDRRGTRWRFAAIPLGGYVRFLGDSSAASGTDHELVRTLSPDERSRTFAGAPLAARAAIVTAGPVANFLLAIVLFAGVFMFMGRPITEARIDAVQENSPAATVGLQPGDVVLSVDDRDIGSFSELQRVISSNADRDLVMLIDREGRRISITARPERREVPDGLGGKMAIGVLGITRSFEDGAMERVYASPGEALILGVEETWFVITRTMNYVGGLITGRESASQLSGPVKIAQVSGKVAEMGVAPLVQLMAILSVSIGLLNLFPIPMLDGGHLMFYLIEALRGRPLSERFQEYGMRVGLVLVMVLMIFATTNDISQLWSL